MSYIKTLQVTLIELSDGIKYVKYQNHVIDCQCCKHGTIVTNYKKWIYGVDALRSSKL